jgi:hypothetical protein
MKAKAGMPLGAVLQSMRVADHCTDAEIQAFRTHIEGGGSTALLSPLAPPAGPPAALRGPPALPPPEGARGPPPPPPGGVRGAAPPPPATKQYERYHVRRSAVHPHKIIADGPGEDPAGSLKTLEEAVRLTYTANIEWTVQSMRNNAWSDEAIEHIDAVQQEIERANPVFSECPEEVFKPYLRGLFAAPHQTSGPLMLGPTVSKMKRDAIDEETMARFKAYAR